MADVEGHKYFTWNITPEVYLTFRIDYWIDIVDNHTKAYGTCAVSEVTTTGLPDMNAAKLVRWAVGNGPVDGDGSGNQTNPNSYWDPNFKTSSSSFVKDAADAHPQLAFVIAQGGYLTNSSSTIARKDFNMNYTGYLYSTISNNTMTITLLYSQQYGGDSGGPYWYKWNPAYPDTTDFSIGPITLDYRPWMVGSTSANALSCNRSAGACKIGSTFSTATEMRTINGGVGQDNYPKTGNFNARLIGQGA
jgi:hypothetical protein